MNTINTFYNDYDNLKKYIIEHHNILFDEDTRSVLVQVFCGICDKDYLSSIVHQICELVPHAHVIGTTTNGEIMNGTVNGLKTVLSFSVFKHSDVRVAFMPQGQLNSYELGKSICEKLNSTRAKLLILFFNGVESSALLEGVQFVNAKLPVAGGISGNNHNDSQCFVFSKDGITTCGVVGVVLESDHLLVNQYWHLCWTPIGKEMVITKSSGSRVFTIDNMPAYQIFKKYLGVNDKSGMIINSIFPLISIRNDMEFVSMPAFVYDDDSIDFSINMIEGEKVRFSFGHVEMILKAIDQLIQKIKRQSVESIFVYSCVLRRGFLQEASEIETLPLQKIAPTVGFFTNGEFFHINNSNQLLQATMTTVALSEADALQETTIQKQEKGIFQETNNDATAKDNVKSSNILILKALTNLANTVSKELIDRSKELEKVNEETLYASTHDALTGLYNRGFYEQKMQNLNSSNVSVGIIICDVDGLKLINDTLGHSSGDITLKATADILKSSFNDDDLVARIGGDEYSVLILNPSISDIRIYRKKVTEAIDHYNELNHSVPLSLSFGYAICENSFENITNLFKEADNNMYREKLHRSRSNRSQLVKTLIQTLEERDIETESHSDRMQDLIAEFSKNLDFSERRISDLRLFARFHDIGKVGIPDHILFKPGLLSEQERVEMQRHSEIGYRIAYSSIDLLPIADWILKHHEWWNGKGYPFGLSGEDIPIECRILSIADSYDAMTNDRPYRKAMRKEDAIKELKRCAGTQFDRILVDKFVAIM